MPLTLRQTKGSPLTIQEMDDNFVYAAAGGATTTTVNISPSETTYSDGRPTVASGILAMGSSPIELLPAPGAGKYYDIDKIILERTDVSTDYVLGEDLYIQQGSGGCYYGISERLFTAYPVVICREPMVKSGTELVYSDTEPNGSLIFYTWNNTNPTLGDGTLRAIITYTTRTFGA